MPEATKASSVEVSVASCTIRGRNPARRQASQTMEETADWRG